MDAPHPVTHPWAGRTIRYREESPLGWSWEPPSSERWAGPCLVRATGTEVLVWDESVNLEVLSPAWVLGRHLDVALATLAEFNCVRRRIGSGIQTGWEEMTTQTIGARPKFRGPPEQMCGTWTHPYRIPWNWGAWVTQWLSVCLRLRLWSWGPGIESHIRLPAGSLLLLPMSLSLSMWLSWINKIFLKMWELTNSANISWLFTTLGIGYKKVKWKRHGYFPHDAYSSGWQIDFK